MNQPISEILAKYETDKVNGHCYGNTYDSIFSTFDRNAPLNILEIGTQKGGSLCAWNDYFPNAKITGVDIVDVVKPEYRRVGGNIRYVFSDIKDWSNDEMYDIIIDDGSHFLGDIDFVASKFISRIKPGGVMIIEDVQDMNTWVRAVHTYTDKESVTIEDLRRINGNYDDCLIIVKK